MLIIVNDDESYLGWVESNPTGFVVDAENPPRAETIRLHRSRCRTITEPSEADWTRESHVKACSNDLPELDRWAQGVAGALPACSVCNPRTATDPPQPPPLVERRAPSTLPFEDYPHGGRQLLGARSPTNTRRGYGLELQRATAQHSCVYCGLDLIDSYEHWLLLQVDHVVPTTMGARLSIPPAWLEDYANLVLACAGCNSFENRFDERSIADAPQTLDEFFDLRDRVFQQRKPRILDALKKERAFFEMRPWEADENSHPTPA